MTTAERQKRTTWIAGLVVAAGAGVATAHGLYEVAAAARVAGPIAWLYPLITDGLALVAYAATARLHHGGRRYAAGIVILAAGLSGLAQAVYLSGGLDGTVAPVGLRFGVGAWPAIAAALTAHLLHLISTDSTAEISIDPVGERSASIDSYSQQPYNLSSNDAVQPPRATDTRPRAAVQPTADPLSAVTNADLPQNGRTHSPSGGRATDRARAAARSHHARHGTLPTVSELTRLAKVARGTAGTVLKDLRKDRPALHIVNAEHENKTEQ